MQVVQWLARYKPRQLAKSGAVKAVMQVLCQLCAEPDPPEHDDADQLPAAKFAAQVAHMSHGTLCDSGIVGSMMDKPYSSGALSISIMHSS